MLNTPGRLTMDYKVKAWISVLGNADPFVSYLYLKYPYANRHQVPCILQLPTAVSSPKTRNSRRFPDCSHLTAIYTWFSFPEVVYTF